MKNSFLVLFILSSLCLLSCKEEPAKLPINNTNINNVFKLKDSFAVKNFKDSAIYRDIWIYLPKNYNTSEKKYPVIYMHDGQNLFDDKTSYAGEWMVDETLQGLASTKNLEFIIVGIENTGNERLNEYSPWKHEKYGGGNGDNYLQMIKNKLKPFIDNSFRTLSDAKNTAIIGSSMGGLISFYAGLEYPNTFGKIGALSTSFWFSNEIPDYVKEKGNLKKSKLYLLVGENEGGNMVTDMKEIEKEILAAGFNRDNLKTQTIPNGKHNEKLWSKELENVITFLFNDNESRNNK